MRALCVGRHRFLSEHLARFFGGPDVETVSAIGLEGALVVAAAVRPQVVICEYELLATLSLDSPERDALLRGAPVVAISLTRRAEDANFGDLAGIAGYLYLPIVRPTDARQALAGVVGAAPYALPTFDRAAPGAIVP